MKIAIDARHISKGGIGEYIREILNRITHEKNLSFLVIAINEEDFSTIKALKLEGVNIIRGPKMFSIREQIWLAKFCRTYKPDIFFSPHVTFPVFSSCSKVLTVHDTIWLNYPQYATSQLARLYFLVMLKLAAWKCKRIICISKSTASDFSHWTGVNSNRIEIIYNGVNLTREHPNISQQLDLPYFVYVGNWKPWKRVPDLIAAFELVDVACANQKVRPKLILAGRHNYNHSDDIASRIQSSTAKEYIQVLGELNRSQLNSLIAGSIALVNPSEYEGFGLTLVEAMALGTAVIAANGGSVPEVMGNAGILVQPRDVNSLSHAMLSVMNNAELRNTLTECGKNKVNEFSWEKTAQLTLNVLLDAGK
ncbi:MAG: Glycogen synthase [Chroococcidiopsis cubana SAG 39.79]|uniref:Glycosyl transferase family 1 n=1 Tax=Chroococcidiopsis cubana SAG 39.79 TaxID=388085 RepID=A0AB37UPQ7_9CYAN|nr:glycosyltransferase family 1 protein [Chroococcidiopsis cubana]MDZ4876206.1 Glycogen synthase [Chroococcidiopsis cubana SAG 39.79]PSB60747.1 hypothetical protein C7B79_24610 [Chroococcidiopsis cubana CCALA 043]RUT13420.1 glycosyl transferase family 1 [Chroococcidiopsis cubana SAG 39.79]